MNENKLDPQMTVGALVRDNPGRAAIFETYGIDYCCGGKRPLAEACAREGVALEAVVASLGEAERPEDEPDLRGLSLTELVDHIEAKHHRYLDSELPRLDALTEKVARVHGERHPELAQLRAVYLELQADLRPHLAKEEQILFPMIRRIDALGAPMPVHGPIRVMLAEHDRAGELLAQLRSLAADYVVPEQACNSWRAMLHGLEGLERDTHRHIHKENNVLFERLS